MRSRAALFGGVAVFLGCGLILAWGNQNPGSPDSLNNLVTARNLARGDGFTTDIVHQFFVPQELPGPETVRPPGIPYLLSVFFSTFGESLAIPVLLNLAIGLLSALVVRSILRLEGEPAFADLAAVLMLFTPAFEPLSLWNNNALVLATAVLLKVGQLNYRGRIRPAPGYILLGLVAGIGFLVKQSFLFTAIPFAAVLAVADDRLGPRFVTRLRAVGMFAATFVIVTSPLWIRDLLLFGRPVYSDMQPSRLVSRYGGSADGLTLWPHGTWWTVRFGRPYGYAELLAELGWVEVLRREALLIGNGLVRLATLNPVITVMAILGAIQARRDRNIRGALIATLFGGVAFSLLYRNVDDRYLWPAIVPLMMLAGMWLTSHREHQVDAGFKLPHSRLPGAALGIALVWGVIASSPIWVDRLIASRVEQPDYGAIVATEVAADAPVITDDPWRVAWYGRRSAVLGPTDSRHGLAAVIALYEPTHFLLTRRHWVSGSPPPEGAVPFLSEELELVTSGSYLGRPWELFRIRTEGEPAAGR